MPSRRTPKPRRVREPIQVYLNAGERAALDRLARELGVSRAEVLRRGLRAVRRAGDQSFYDVFDRLIGTLDRAGAPTDLAERFDRYLADDLERKWRGRRSS